MENTIEDANIFAEAYLMASKNINNKMIYDGSPNLYEDGYGIVLLDNGVFAALVDNTPYQSLNRAYLNGDKPMISTWSVGPEISGDPYTCIHRYHMYSNKGKRKGVRSVVAYWDLKGRKEYYASQSTIEDILYDKDISNKSYLSELNLVPL